MCIRRASLVLGFAFAWNCLGPVSANIEDDGACPLFILLPFTSTYTVPPDIKRSSRNQYNPWTASISAQISYSYAAAALLAMEHWNTRNAAVVPELGEIDDGCTVYFPDPKYADSLTDGGRSVPAFFELTEGDKKRPCAILAPLEEKSTFKLQSISAAFEIPMLVHFIENDLFAEEDSLSPGTATMSLSAPGRARAMVQYLQSREYFNIASWRSNFKQDTLLAEMIEKIGEEMFNLDVALFVVEAAPPGQDEDDSVMESLRQLKDNGFTTIFLASVQEPYKLAQLAFYLNQLQMLTEDYFFILPPSLLPPTFSNTTTNKALEELYGEQVPGSPLDKLLSGSIIFDSMDGFEVNCHQRNNTDCDPFLKAWNQQGPENVRRLNELVPSNWLNANPDYFQVVKPSRGSSFVYDSVMAIGFGGCTKQRMDRETVWSSMKDPDAPPPDLDLGPGFLPVAEPYPLHSNESQEVLGEQNMPDHSRGSNHPVLPDENTTITGARNDSLPIEERSDAKHSDVSQESPRPSPVEERDGPDFVFPDFVFPSFASDKFAPLPPTQADSPLVLLNNNPVSEPNSMNSNMGPSSLTMMPSKAAAFAPSTTANVNFGLPKVPTVSKAAPPTRTNDDFGLPKLPTVSKAAPPGSMSTGVIHVDSTNKPTRLPKSTPISAGVLTTGPSTLPKQTPTPVLSTVPPAESSHRSSLVPSSVPSDATTVLHSEVLSSEPTLLSSGLPSVLPSDSPTVLHSALPSTMLSQKPSSLSVLSSLPSDAPSLQHSDVPSSEPGLIPSSLSSVFPSNSPTVLHSTVSSAEPSQSPSLVLKAVPSDAPTIMHSELPSNEPSLLPSSLPSVLPSDVPTLLHSTAPSAEPSQNPSSVPSEAPTVLHSELPSSEPSLLLSKLPSVLPSDVPTLLHSTVPSADPSQSPALVPSSVPSDAPTFLHSEVPSSEPSFLPSSMPSVLPSDVPTLLHSTAPSAEPSQNPSSVPSEAPTVLHSELPSSEPSLSPSSLPSVLPSDVPTLLHSTAPTAEPSQSPSLVPSSVPSDAPTILHSEVPSSEPSFLPSSMPSVLPSDVPTLLHSTAPSAESSQSPSLMPSEAPTVVHSELPSNEPIFLPSSEPSALPRDPPTQLPSYLPSDLPSNSCVPAPWFDVLNPSVNMGYLDCFVLDLGSYSFPSIGFSLNIPFPGQIVDFFLDSTYLGPPTSISGKTYTLGPSVGLLSYLESLSPGMYRLSATAFPVGFIFWADFEVIPTRRLQSTVPEVLSPLLSSILKSKFSGASGLVEFGKEYEKGRNYEGITVGIYNIRPNEVNSDTGKRSFGAFLISTWEEGVGWVGVPGATLVYRDGSKSFSGVYRRIFNAHYITPRVRVIGLLLMAIAWMVALTSLGLLIFLRKEAIIQHTVPISMHIICVGSIITSTTVFTVSFDEAATWTNQQLSVACSLTPWFFFVGHLLIFGGLFIRLWQFDCALQFRQIYTSICMSLWPLALLLVTTISILLAHTLYDPWSWERNIISEMPAETYGKCQSEHAWAFFFPLVGLLFVAEAITLFLAWKTVDVKSHFQDSSSVMYACFAQIQAWSIGVPMLAFIGHSSADGTYFARLFLIWIFSVSGVVLVVVPKLYKAIQHRRSPQSPISRRRVSISGLYSQKSENSSLRSRNAGFELSVRHQGLISPSVLRLIQEEDSPPSAE